MQTFIATMALNINAGTGQTLGYVPGRQECARPRCRDVQIRSSRTVTHVVNA